MNAGIGRSARASSGGFIGLEFGVEAKKARWIKRATYSSTAKPLQPFGLVLLFASSKRRESMSSTIESVLQETRVFPPPPELVRQANVSGMDAYRKLCAEAEKDFEGFWARLARETLQWSKPFSKILDESKAPFYRWFYDGELNASYNCLDRHLKTQPDKVALIFEADDGKVTKVTYLQLHQRVCEFANGLKSLGIKKGDRVLIYLPMSVEA